MHVTQERDTPIRKIAPNGIITTIAGGGTLVPGQSEGHPATQARLYYPSGVAVDSAGAVYFTSDHVPDANDTGDRMLHAGSSPFAFLREFTRQRRPLLHKLLHRCWLACRGASFLTFFLCSSVQVLVAWRWWWCSRGSSRASSRNSCS